MTKPKSKTKPKAKIVARPNYRCPEHGVITDETVFFSHISEYEGTWCVRCMIDVLNANPCISRVTDLADEEKEEDAKSKSD